MDEEAAHGIAAFGATDPGTLGLRLEFIDEAGVLAPALDTDASVPGLIYACARGNDAIGIDIHKAAERCQRWQALGIVGDRISAPMLAQAIQPLVHGFVFKQFFGLHDERYSGKPRRSASALISALRSALSALAGRWIIFAVFSFSTTVSSRRNGTP